MRVLHLIAMKIPGPLIAVVSTVLERRYTHSQLDNRFLQAGFPEEVPGGNKLEKCRIWMNSANMSRQIQNPLANVGMLIEEIMEVVPSHGSLSIIDEGKERIERQLDTLGLRYRVGGHIYPVNTTLTTRTLDQIIKERDLRGVETEFDRILVNLDSDPGAAITASCALLESLFKTYINDEQLGLPSDQSVLPLWKIVRSHLKLNPGEVKDENLKKILGGVATTIDGLAGLRTRTGSAHGHDARVVYKVEPRHARLAAHAAMTLATFLIEAADSQKRKSSSAVTSRLT
jgi:hypothetical protein